MTSRRSWLLGLALGAAVTVGSIHDVHAQGVPRSFTYQGVLLNGTQPENGNHSIRIQIKATGGGAVLFDNTYNNTPVVNGIFNIVVGAPPGTLFPPTMMFDEQYVMTVFVDGVELPQATELHSAPYALNADAIDGFHASPNSAPNTVVVSNNNGKIDAAWLPDAPNSILTINGLGPNTAGDFTITSSSPNLTVTPGTNGVVLGLSGNSGGIQAIQTGQGLIGGGGPDANGNVFIGLGPNAIDNTMIGNGVITGAKLASVVAGLGLYQDILGNLNVGVDNQTIEIPTGGDLLQIKAGGVGTAQLADGAVTNPKIADGAVNAAKVDPTQVQLRVTGTAPAGSFVTGINQNGSVNSATVLVNSTLTRAVTGNDLTLGINLANPNTWTGAQNFNGGATATSLGVTGPTTLTGTVTQSGGQVTVGGNIDANGGLDVVGATTVVGSTTLTGAVTQSGGQVTIGGNIDANGGLDVVGASTFAGAITQTGGGQITLSGNVDANNGLDVVGPTTTQGITNTGNVATTTLSTTGNATIGGSASIGDDLNVTNQITAPAAGHSMGSPGMNATVLTINGVTDGGAVDEFVVNGDAAFSGVVDFNDITADVITANTVNTANLGGNGGAINLTSNVNAGANTINNGIFSGYTLHTGNIAVGHTLTNNGTILGGTMSNAQITGGNINGTIIGNTTPAEGTFTDLTVNNVAEIEELQVNTTSHFDGLSTFGTSPALNGNKVVIDGIVSPSPIASTSDYEFVVNGDAQVTGTLFATNFQSLVLQAPTIKFDVAMPFSGTTMTFQGGTMIHNGLGTFDHGMTFVNTPAGFYGIHVDGSPGSNGIKLTGNMGPIGLDVDPYLTGIRVDATNMGIQLINAPISLQADGIIDAMGTIENSGGNVTIADALDQTGGGQVTLSGNVDANAGLDVTGLSTFAGAMTQTGGGPINLSGAITGTSGGNTLGDGVDGIQLTVSGVVGGATEFHVIGDATIDGALTAGSLSLLGDLDMNGNDILDVDDLQFSQATSDISNTGGNVVINDNAVVTGTTDLQGVVSDSNSDLTFGDNIIVTGTSDFQGNIFDSNSDLTVQDNMIVNGNTQHNGNVVTTGTLDQQGNIFSSTGSVTVNDNFVVTGTSDLQGVVSDSNSDLTFGDNTITTGTADFQSFIFDSNSELTINDALIVTGTSDLQGNVFDSNSDLTFADNTITTGTADHQGVIFDSNSELTISDDLIVTGTSDLQGNVFDSNSDLTFADNTITTGTADHQGFIFDSNSELTVNDDLIVTGTSDLQGNVFDSNSELTIADDVIVTGTSDLQGNVFDSNSDLTIADNVIVTGTSDLQGNVFDSNSDLTLDDNIIVTGTSDLQNSVFNSTANNGGRVHVNDEFETVGNTFLATASGSDLTVGNADGLGTHLINGSTIFDGTGAAADVIHVQDVPAGFEGLHIDAGVNAAAGARIDVSGASNTIGIDINATGTGASNNAIDISVSGAGTTNRGLNISVMGSGAIGGTINGNNTVGSTGLQVMGSINGVTVDNPAGVVSTAFQATLNGGGTAQTGMAIDMNTAASGANGVAVTEVGSGTGVSVAMSGAGSGVGMNVDLVGAGTGINVLGATGGGSGIISNISDAGSTGSAVRAITSSTVPSAEAIRATGVATGAAAIDVTGGGVDATAAAGARFADTHPGGAGAVDVVINNTVVRSNSTIILTHKNTAGAFVAGALVVVAQSNGSFTVRKTALWSAGDQIEYIIINHGS